MNQNYLTLTDPVFHNGWTLETFLKIVWIYIILTLKVGSLSLLDKLDKDGVEVLFFK